MSENFDFDADLNALLGLGGESTAPAMTSVEPVEAAAPVTQAEPQETASGLPEPDLVALLDPEGLAQQPLPVVEPVPATEDRAERTAKEGRLPVMHDAEGRKLGPAGLLLALQRDQRLAHQAGDQAEIERLAGLVQEADMAVEAFMKKSGLSRAELFPSLMAQSSASQDEVAEALTKLRQIAVRRQELEAELLDLYQRLGSARELLAIGLWAPAHVKTAHGLARQIEAVTWPWSWAETQAWRVAYETGLIPGKPIQADWSPFQLIESTRP